MSDVWSYYKSDICTIHRSADFEFFNGLVAELFAKRVPEVTGCNLHSYSVFPSSNPNMFISGCIPDSDMFVCTLFCDFTGTNRVSATAIEVRSRSSEDCASHAADSSATSAQLAFKNIVFDD